MYSWAFVHAVAALGREALGQQAVAGSVRSRVHEAPPATVNAADLSWTLPLSAVPAPLAPLQVHDDKCRGPAALTLRGALARVGSDKIPEWTVAFRVTRKQYTELLFLESPVLCQKEKVVAKLQLGSFFFYPHHIIANYLEGLDGHAEAFLLEAGFCAVCILLLVGVALLGWTLRLAYVDAMEMEPRERYATMQAAKRLFGPVSLFLSASVLLVLFLLCWLGFLAGKVSLFAVVFFLAPLSYVFYKALYLAYSIVLRLSLRRPFEDHQVAIIFRNIKDYNPHNLRSALGAAGCIAAVIAYKVAAVDAGFARGPLVGRFLVVFVPVAGALWMLHWLLQDQLERLCGFGTPTDGRDLVWAEQVVGASRALTDLGSDMTVEQVLRVAAELSEPMAAQLEQEEDELEILDSSEEKTESLDQRARRHHRNIMRSKSNADKRISNAAVRKVFQEQREKLLERTEQEQPLVSAQLSDVEPRDAIWAMTEREQKTLKGVIAVPAAVAILATMMLILTWLAQVPQVRFLEPGGDLVLPWTPGPNALLQDGHRSKDMEVKFIPGPSASSVSVELEGEHVPLVAEEGVLTARLPRAKGPVPQQLTVRVDGAGRPALYDVTLLSLVNLAFADFSAPGSEEGHCFALPPRYPSATAGAPPMQYVPEAVTKEAAQLTVWETSFPYGVPLLGLTPSSDCAPCADLCAYHEEARGGGECYQLRAADAQSFCAPYVQQAAAPRKANSSAVVTVSGFVSQGARHSSGRSGTALQYRGGDEALSVYRGHGMLGIEELTTDPLFGSKDKAAQLVVQLGSGTRSLELRTGLPRLQFSLQIKERRYPVAVLPETVGHGKLCADKASGGLLALDWDAGAAVGVAGRAGQKAFAPKQGAASMNVGALGDDGLALELTGTGNEKHQATITWGDPAACVKLAQSRLAEKEHAEAAEILRGTLVKTLSFTEPLSADATNFVGSSLSPYVRTVAFSDGWAHLAHVPDGTQVAVELLKRAVTHVDLRGVTVTAPLDGEFLNAEALVLDSAVLPTNFMPLATSVVNWKQLDVSHADYEPAKAVSSAGSTAEGDRGLFLPGQHYPRLAEVRADGASMELVTALIDRIGNSATPVLELTSLQNADLEPVDLQLARLWPRLRGDSALLLRDKLGDEPLVTAAKENAIAEITWPKLDLLGYRSAGVTPKGVAALVQLAHGKLLRSLDLRGNEVSRDEAESLLTEPLACLVLDAPGPEVAEAYASRLCLLDSDAPAPRGDCKQCKGAAPRVAKAAKAPAAELGSAAAGPAFPVDEVTAAPVRRSSSSRKSSLVEEELGDSFWRKALQPHVGAEAAAVGS